MHVEPVQKLSRREIREELEALEAVTVVFQHKQQKHKYESRVVVAAAAAAFVEASVNPQTEETY